MALWRRVSSTCTSCQWQQQQQQAGVMMMVAARWCSSGETRARGHWDLQENRRAMMDEVKAKLNISKPSDWKKVTSTMLKEAGAGGLLSRHGNSVYRVLVDAYPEEELKESECRGKMPHGYWKEQENRRSFLEEAGRQLGVREQSGWREVEKKQIVELGGGGLLQRFKGSLLAALQDSFPELQWDALELRRKAPQGYWQDEETRRQWLLAAAKELKIEKMEDWKRVTTEDVKSINGGHSFIRLYDGSIFKALQELLGEDEGTLAETEWRPQVRGGYWKKQENRRALMEKIGRELGVEDVTGWRKVTSGDIVKAGGGTVLNLFSGSVYEMLKDSFPEKVTSMEQVRARKGMGHWKERENRRAAVKQIAEKLGVREEGQWKNVGNAEFVAAGGGSVLSYHGGSLLNVLTDYYGEGEQEGKSVPYGHAMRNILPSTYWDEPENITAFLETVKKELHVSSPEEWARVSVQDIRQLRGDGLLRKMKLLDALKMAYPTVRFDDAAFGKTSDKKSTQRNLMVRVASIFRGTDAHQVARAAE